MKHLIIIGDGMADHKVESLGGKTLLQYASIPYMDLLAKMGRTGRLVTVPKGFPPGSEVANTSILGYNLEEVFQGRGPIEAASIGYEMKEGDLALRCNIICLDKERIKNHHGGHLSTLEARELINYLNEKLGSPQIQFIPGIQYRHLLIIKGGNKHIVCAPPHDNPDKPWRPLMVKPEKGWEDKKDGDSMTAKQTADIINDLIIKSQALLPFHPINIKRRENHMDEANSIWTWSGGYRPKMLPLNQRFPQIKTGSVITAVDLIKGIGHYAGLKAVEVPGATGLSNTNYEGKAQAAIEALKKEDFVFLHVEASDEAGHDGDISLKLKTIEYLDQRILKPIYEEVVSWHNDPVCIAVLPDHPTPVEVRTHVSEPVPFLIWYPGITPDEVTKYDEESCLKGYYGLVDEGGFMDLLMNL